jgi:hypothetical protein
MTHSNYHHVSQRIESKRVTMTDVNDATPSSPSFPLQTDKKSGTGSAISGQM